MDAINSSRGETGKAFGSAYLNGQTNDHEAMIALFQEEASRGTDTDLKALAKKTLSTSRHHEAMVKAAAGKAG
jgi:predicted outer membrane protein